MQNIVRRHHEHACFQLRFKRQRHVHSHLVTVKVSIERSANERVKLDRFPFNQHRFKRLNTQTVKRRRAVQKNRMLPDHFFQNIPNLRTFFLHKLLGLLHRGTETLGFKARIDERFEKLKRHLLRQAALVKLQLRTHHDNRTTGIVDALAKQVLAETPLLTLQHVRKRLQRPLVGTRNHTATTTIVKERIDGFLQHPLFVTDDDVGCTKLHQALQTVVTIDHTTV